ncbi:MAG TPA: TrmH family RNA methyltransferase [Candidatus Binatia bacterium]|jgi:23S rRNA (guanosine2251-2'-O)-methyltransferase|nr:TrmH family RNA methyltransferase [Candidatus Binatia bacterium]
MPLFKTSQAPSSLILIIHNVRSTHNVGSMLRSSDGLGVDKVYMTGYTPYPRQVRDSRLPHLASKIDNQIHKTALGAETTVNWQFEPDIAVLIKHLRREGYAICALEQTPDSIALPEFKPPAKLALIVGREVEGLEEQVIQAADYCVAIPMLGQKESFNVAVAAAIALYHCRYCQIG